MHRLFAALILFLSFTFASVARADSFQYTIVWDLPHVAGSNTSEFVGTYTFTVDSLLTGNTFVYGHGFTDTPFPGYPYVYAPDFTGPAGSNVDQIEISYFPDYTPYNSFGEKTLYSFTLYQSAGGAAAGTSLIQDPTDPNKFFASYGDSGSASMQITDVSSSTVPEPSSITLLGIGILSVGSVIHQRAKRVTRA